jgi:hypothetical protein
MSSGQRIWKPSGSGSLDGSRKHRRINMDYTHSHTGFEIGFFVDNIENDVATLSIWIGNGDATKTLKKIEIKEFEGMAIPLDISISARAQDPKKWEKVTDG